MPSPDRTLRVSKAYLLWRQVAERSRRNVMCEEYNGRIITKISNPEHIRYFLEVDVDFFVEINLRTRPCKVSFLDVPLVGWSGIIADYEDGTSDALDFQDMNKTWVLSFTIC
jgi:hypothetical protein